VNQARRSNRRVNSPKQKLIGHGLREIVFIFFCFVGLYLFVSLLTYYPLDPGWSHGDQVEGIQNKGGVAGAIFAEIFFDLFGYFAYLFPVMVGYVGWLIYRGKHHDILAQPKDLIVPGFGFVLTLSAGCGLAIVHFAAESILLPSHAGGILGIWVGKSLVAVFDQLGATLILLAVFFTGVTLLTGLSWLKLMDTLGLHTLRWLPLVNKYASRNLLPWLRHYSRHGFQISLQMFKRLFVRAQKGIKVAYARWQTQRQEWRREREQFEYEDDDEDYEDDDYFIKEEHSVDEPKRSAAPQASPSVDIPTAEPIRVEATPLCAPTSPPPIAELSLLDPVPTPAAAMSPEQLSQWIIEGFETIGVKVEVKAVYPGPRLVGFEVYTQTPLNTQHLDELGEALAHALAVNKVYIVETQPDILGVELPHPEPQVIYLSTLLHNQAYQDSHSALTIALGQDSSGQPVIIDLSHIPHILIAGCSAEEKNIAIHTIVLSMLYKSSPKAVRLLLVDSAAQELAVYTELPHLLTPVITEGERLPEALTWCLQEMERRYRLMARHSVRNIESYNQSLLEQPEGSETEGLPYIVVIIHEISDINKTPFGGQVEELITRLTQKARAAGIHLILATAHPSVNVITGLIKSNIPTRIAFRVQQKSESRVILGQAGAEFLLGQGDMFYMTAGTGMPVRMHGCFVKEQEVRRVVTDLKSRAQPDYILLKETAEASLS